MSRLWSRLSQNASAVMATAVIAALSPLSVFGSSNAFAAAPSSSFISRFSAQAIEIPQTLLLQRCPSPAASCPLGDFDLRALVRDIQSVKWRGNGYGYLAGSGECRTGAVYSVKERAVALNLMRAQFEPVRTMPIAALHEAHGALGNLDEHYEKSLAMYFLSLTEIERQTFFGEDLTPLFIETLSNTQKRTSEAIYIAQGGGGGATSIGGGGDGVAVQAKTYAMIFARAICKQLGRPCTDIHARLLKAQVEIACDAMATSLVTERKSDGKTIYRVPLVPWLNGNIRTSEEYLDPFQMQVLRSLIVDLNSSRPHP